MARPKRITPEQVVALLARIADDGYCPTAELARELPGASHRDRISVIHRAVNAGLLLERRATDGRPHVALSSEGWVLLRAGQSP